MTIEARVKGERSRHTVVVTPPAVERVGGGGGGKAWELIDSRAVVICADHEQASLWAEAAPPEYRAHAVTGLSRAAALLKEGRVGLLVGAPADLAALVARAALKLEAIESIVLAWPESFSGELDALLAEAPNARRVILSWNPPSLSEFLERHARRAEVIGDLPLDTDGTPLGPVGSARYAVVAATRRTAGVRDALNTLRATRPYVWYGGEIAPPADVDVVVAGTLPTRAEMQGLIAAQAQPVVLALATQLPYLRSIAALTPLPFSPAADRATDRAAALRGRVAERLARGDVDAELALLAPLFEDYDPALVAGALLALQRETGNEKRETVAPASLPDDGGAWARLFVTAGRKDKASAKDLVGALIKEAGLQKGQIGKIHVRETFSLVEVAPSIAEQAVRRLTGVSIRGRRVTARPDRA
ncbi:MAG TPA: DbpA RNA binding domain-containing protein [Gemmatimonadales bacterium]|nr:DbpA RNA binding domain-containing protein [Gemmatimonadales bacterium]